MTIQIDNVDTSISAVGTDANIAIDLQPKGTGALNVAAGSSGVNISNGTTVTSVVRSNSGSGYTIIPNVIIAAPQIAGGVQATATFLIFTTSVSINSGGTGYTVGDVLTVVGGTFQTVAAQVTVTSVSSGVITGATVSGVNYSVMPPVPASVTGGTGSSATFTISGVIQGTATITNAGSGYVEQPTVTFSGGGGGSGAAAYASVGAIPSVRSLNSIFDFFGSAGRGLRINTGFYAGALTDWVAALPSNFGGPTLIADNGAGGNVTLRLSSSGTSPVDIFTSGTGNRQLSVAHTASAVNFLQVTGSATTGNVTLSAQGSDTNIGITYLGKGGGSSVMRGDGGVFWQNAAGNSLFSVENTASSVNRLTATGGVAGNAPRIFAQGSDTNIPLVLQPKGTGALQAQQTDSTATGGNARGANAVDWQTLRTNANRVASGANSVIGGGWDNLCSGFVSTVAGGVNCASTNNFTTVAGGRNNTASGSYSGITSGYINTAAGYFNFIGGGFTNSGTANAAVTTQSGTMNGTTAVTLSGSNASIRVGQLIIGTSIAEDTYVAAISGTSLTLSKIASGSSTSTLSFFTPHGVVVGGGNNQATGSYSFIGGGGDAGTAANRNVASGSWSAVVGGISNTASGTSSFVGGGGFDGTTIVSNTASGTASSILGGVGNTASGIGATTLGGYQNTASGLISTVSGRFGSARSISGNTVFAACNVPMGVVAGIQGSLLILARQTTDATPTVLASDSAAAGTTNQVILPNNSAYLFRATVISGVTGGGNTSAWILEGAIKRGANAASTAIVGSVTTNLLARDAGASTWAITATADTTNGGLAITFTGQAGTTIRTVAKVETTEMTF